MQCVDVAGLQKYAMGQADTKYDAKRCNAGERAEKGARKMCGQNRVSCVAAKKAKKTNNSDGTVRYPVGALT